MSYYYDGPTYGIADRQQARVLAYCEKCGGEIYDEWHAETGLCEDCEKDVIDKEEE